MGNGISGSWLSTVPVALTGHTQVDSLFGDYIWRGSNNPGTPLEITYSFPSPGSWNTDYSDLQEYTMLQPFDLGLRAVARAALDAWERVANVTFREVADNVDQAGDLRFALTTRVDVDNAAHAYLPLPGDQAQSGDIWFKIGEDWSDIAFGGRSLLVMLHEIGHALGLKHPHETSGSNTALMPAQWNSSDYTVMSYNREEDGALPATPMYFDIQAIQELYGPNPTATLSNDLYRVSAADLTLWDAGGIDTLDFSSLAISDPEGADIRLTPNFSSNAGSVIVQLMPDTEIENAVGTAADDTLVGNAAANRLVGGWGSDTLDGTDGLDVAAWSGPSRTYAITLDAARHTVADGSGTDHAVSVESLIFADGALVTGTAHPAAQIFRLYDSALGRAPDADGLNGWTLAIESGEITLRDATADFVGSPEFVQRYGQLDNQGFVSLLYANVLGRAPDAEGLAQWTRALDSGFGRPDALLGFSESLENIGRTRVEIEDGLWLRDEQAAAVARLYDSAFDRLPDAGGLVGWTGALKAGMSLGEVATSFITPPEFQQRYGSLDDRAFVAQLYRNVLGREADPGGLDAWSGVLTAGAPRAEVVLSFSESPEHRIQCAPYIDDGVWLI